MLLLAIETATDLVGAALALDGAVVAESKTAGSRRRHAECLLPAIRHVLDQVQAAPADLDAVAVDTGPGLFTGLRVGVATANGLAAGLGIGVVPVGSLEALADDRPGGVLSVVDARRGQLFVAFFSDGHPARPPALVDPPDLSALVAELVAVGAGAPVVAVGDGARRYAEVLASVPGIHLDLRAGAWPEPAAVARTALRRLDADPAAAVSPPVLPDYLRGADVKVGWTSRAVPANPEPANPEPANPEPVAGS